MKPNLAIYRLRPDNRKAPNFIEWILLVLFLDFNLLNRYSNKAIHLFPWNLRDSTFSFLSFPYKFWSACYVDYILLLFFHYPNLFVNLNLFIPDNVFIIIYIHIICLWNSYLYVFQSLVSCLARENSLPVTVNVCLRYCERKSNIYISVVQFFFSNSGPFLFL